MFGIEFHMQWNLSGCPVMCNYPCQSSDLFVDRVRLSVHRHYR